MVRNALNVKLATSSPRASRPDLQLPDINSKLSHQILQDGVLVHGRADGGTARVARGQRSSVLEAFKGRGEPLRYHDDKRIGDGRKRSSGWEEEMLQK